MKLKLLIKYMMGEIYCRFRHIKHGKKCYVGVFVKSVNNGKIIFGEDVRIRPYADIMAFTKHSILKIQDGSDIGERTRIVCANSITIEDHVLIAQNVFISDNNHKYTDVNVPIMKQGLDYQQNSVIIGGGSWIGTNCSIIGNIKIGKHCIIGANSVVTKDIPDYSIAVGIPARVVKRYDFEKCSWVKV